DAFAFGTSVIPQIGHSPGWSWMIEGCIGHCHSCCADSVVLVPGDRVRKEPAIETTATSAATATSTQRTIAIVATPFGWSGAVIASLRRQPASRRRAPDRSGWTPARRARA